MLRDNVEFTYFRDDYGSRLDRIYATDFKSSISNIVTKPIPFSDHHGVIINITFENIVEMGKYYWKLNTKLLEHEFKNEYNKMVKLFFRFPTLYARFLLMQ